MQVKYVFESQNNLKLMMDAARSYTVGWGNKLKKKKKNMSKN